MSYPKWVPDFLERESHKRRYATALILCRAAKDPTDTNLLAASQALAKGPYRVGSS